MPKNTKTIKHGSGMDKAMQKLVKIKYIKLLLLWLLSFLILSGSLMTAFLNSYNYLEIFPKELIFPLLMHLVTSIIIALIVGFVPWPRLFVPKTITVFILSFFMVNYNDRLNLVSDIYKAMVPIMQTQSNSYPLISVFFLLTIFSLALFVGVLLQKYLIKSKKTENYNLAYLIYIIVGFIFVSQAYLIVTILPEVMRESKVQPQSITSSNTKSSASAKPDIYYIVLDRYTNNQVLSQQYNYDNSKFTNYLKDNGFYVNEDAYSNYPLTTMSISSTLNVDYTKKYVEPYSSSKIQSRTLYHNLIWQSSVIKALKNEGYTYHHIGSVYGATYKAPLADKDYVNVAKISIFNRFSKVLRGIEIAQFNQSPYYQLFKVNLNWPFKDIEFDNAGYVKAQLDSLNQIAESKSGGRFIFAHILVPHDPFTFNADGSISAYPLTDNAGKTIKQKYLEQLEFINSQIKQVVSTINESSNNQAVIILSADEGAYPQDMNNTSMNPIDTTGVLEKGDMTKWPDDWLKMKFGILQAVHIPKSNQQELDNNLSSVNIFRIILNNYLGYKFEYLPNCNFAFNNGDEFMYKYSDITQKLTGNEQSNQFCKSKQTN